MTQVVGSLLLTGDGLNSELQALAWKPLLWRKVIGHCTNMETLSLALPVYVRFFASQVN